MSDQGLGWFPLGLVLDIEVEPSELSCMFSKREHQMPPTCMEGWGSIPPDPLDVDSL